MCLARDFVAGLHLYLSAKSLAMVHQFFLKSKKNILSGRRRGRERQSWREILGSISDDGVAVETKVANGSSNSRLLLSGIHYVVPLSALLFRGRAH